MIDRLTRGLVNRGHDVTLFASGDSDTPARLHAVVPRATQDDLSSDLYLEKEYDVRNVAEAYAHADHFDLFHAHWPTPAPYFSDRTGRPSLLTCDYIRKPLFDYYRSRYPGLRFACVSRAQAELLGQDLPVIHNGVDVEAIPFGARPEDFLLSVGRLVPTKGADMAIRVARRLGRPLVLVGDVSPYITGSRHFYEEQVLPFVDGVSVRHIPRLANDQVLALMSRAAAFLFPISWEEPFGLVVAEAMAAGTPVVATPRGSMPELVEPGLTGFLGTTEEELADAVERASRLNRRACRRRACERFGIDQMVSAYEQLYEEIVCS